MFETESVPTVESAVLLDSEPHSFRTAAWIVLGLALLLFGLQLRSLYVYPIPDSVRWGGDETWLMREFGNQAEHGVMSYPESFDGSRRTDGVLAGSMWVEAVLYGGLGNAVASPSTSLVEIGRSATAILSALLLVSIFLACRRIGVSRLLASLAVLLVTSSVAFVIATHSARYDILTGLGLLGFILLFSTHSSRERRPALQALFGVAAVSCIIVSRHLLTLTLPVTLLWLWRQRIWDSWKRSAGFVLCAVGALTALIAAYWAGTSNITLFGGGGALGSYDFVLKQLPILRPFSRSVQLGNLQERYDLLTKEAPGLLLIVLTATVIAASYWAWKLSLRYVPKRATVGARPDQSFFAMASALSTLSWLLLQGARPYYMMHVIPVLIVSAMLILEWLHELFESVPLLRYPVPALALLLCVVQAPRSIRTPELGERIVQDQKNTMHRFLSKVDSGKVLCDVAGLNFALEAGTASKAEVKTLDMFQPPPAAEPLERRLQENRIQFIILHSSPVASPFEPGRAYLADYLRGQATVLDSALGIYYDDGRQYDSGVAYAIKQGLDTMRLYRIDSRLSSATP